MVERWLLAAAVAVVGTCATGALAEAQPPADPVSIWTIQDENATISSEKLTDRNYVNGLRIGWTSPTGLVPDFLATVGHTVWGDGQQRISFDLEQSIFTPAQTQLDPPDPHDRPYAGVLTANFGLLQDADTWRSTFGVQLGLVGPDAGGEAIQNGFHDIIGQGHNRGWSYQIHNEPVIELTTNRTWRVPLASFAGVETDALPAIQGGVGNLRVYGLAGAVFRLGQGLNSDYGVARVQPALTGGDAYKPTRPFAWYIFAGLDGQAVAHDITLDGNSFESSARVTRSPFVGELEAGVAMMVYGMRLTYTQVVQTQEFRGQHGGPHQFGSLALSARF